MPDIPNPATMPRPPGGAVDTRIVSLIPAVRAERLGDSPPCR
jgi:hypothetical protein